jgi:hypothetical protein
MSETISWTIPNLSKYEFFYNKETDEFRCYSKRFKRDMKYHKGKCGYYIIRLWNDDGKRVSKTIHRLIAKKLIPNPENKPCVDHIDRNPFNNKLSNLRWVTISENCLNSGKGYGFKTQNNKWRVRVNQKFYGHYETEEEAKQKAKEVRKSLGIPTT